MTNLIDVRIYDDQIGLSYQETHFYLQLEIIALENTITLQEGTEENRVTENNSQSTFRSYSTKLIRNTPSTE